VKAIVHKETIIEYITLEYEKTRR